MREEVCKLIRLAVERPARGVPALIGPPQWGKTHLVLELMHSMGVKRVLQVNPQQDFPEDIGGWPVRRGSELSFTQPSLVPAEIAKRWRQGDAAKAALFIDELDKARDGTLSALLTLLNPGERRLRELRVPDGVPIVVAMNEPKRELPEPLVARLLFVAWPQPGAVPRELPGLAAFSRSLERLAVPEVRFPGREATPGAFYKLKEWVACEEFWADQRLQELVVFGLFPGEEAKRIIADLRDATPETNAVEWVKQAGPPQLLEGLYFAIHYASPAERGRIFEILAKRSNADQTGEIARIVDFLLLHENEAIRRHTRAQVEGKADLKELEAEVRRLVDKFKKQRAGDKK